MMLLTLNPKDKTVKMLSIPRDLYVYLPGFRVDRINTADVRGGFQMTADTLHYNFGIRPDYWIRVNFTGFMNAIDTLGGIDVQVTDYLTDECGRRWWSYGPGSYRMGGFEALCYVRMRKSTGDFDRLRRQQEVINGIFDRILSIDGLKQVPELYEQFEYTFETNMQLKDVMPLLPLAAEVASDRSRIQQYRIDASLADHWRVPYSGAAVLLPKWDPIQQLLQEAY
jgi:LCP family protein required for cell wall assembly